MHAYSVHASMHNMHVHVYMHVISSMYDDMR